MPIHSQMFTVTANPLTGQQAWADVALNVWALPSDPQPAWASMWEDIVPLGGSSLGGTSTGGFILNPGSVSADVTITVLQRAVRSGNDVESDH